MILLLTHQKGHGVPDGDGLWQFLPGGEGKGEPLLAPYHATPHAPLLVRLLQVRLVGQLQLEHRRSTDCLGTLSCLRGPTPAT